MAGGTRSYEMARRLVLMGHEVNMVTSWRQSDQRTKWFKTVEAGINVYWLPIPYSNQMGFWQRISAFLKFAFYSSFKASSLPSDIILATSTPLTIAIPAICSKFYRRVPLVFEVRDLWPSIPIALGIIRNPILITLSRLLETISYSQSTSVIALSPGMKSGIINTGYSPDRIAVIPNSCDNEEFSSSLSTDQFRTQRPWLSNSPLLIYAGTFGYINDITYAVRLAKQLLLLRSNIKILLVGEGAEKQLVYNAAHEESVLNKNLFIEAELPKSHMPALFDAATATLSLFRDIPEMRSNSANKFFDSLAARKPVILNYGGWMYDLVLRHHCGYNAWGKSVKEVANDLHILLNTKDWVSRSGSAAHNLALLYFDRDTLADQLEALLTSSIRGDGSLASSIAPGNFP